MNIKSSGAKFNHSRRQFIVKTAVAGGGLSLGLYVPFSAFAQSTIPLKTSDEINVWVVVKPDDTCIIRIARSEMGQGTRTGLAQLVAEELECDWVKVKTQIPTAGQNNARNRAWGDMSTGGSRGIRTSQEYVRQGGAAARIMLMQAAANKWNVSVSDLKVDKGVITHIPSGRKISYGKVANDAALLTPPDPKTIILKKPQSWKIAGTSVPRLDTADKVNGSKVFAIDL